MDVEKANRDKRADRQEQDLVKQELRQGNVSYRVDKEFDVFTIRRDGTIFLTDCKSSEQALFYVDRKDINKGLDCVRKWQERLPNVRIVFNLYMWFSFTHQNSNKRYISIDESYRNCSLRVWKTPCKIMTEKIG